MKPSLVLASQSPRRKELLTAAGYLFETRKYDIEEIYPDNLTNPTEIAVYLAELKSQTAQQELGEDEVVLTSDTIVVFEGEILGKPIDRDDAIHTLQRLSGAKHQVVTAVSIANSQNQLSDFATADVLFCDLTIDEIEYYINTCNPMDKAGSYGIQDWLGLCKIDHILGNQSTVMGLPMELVYRMLKEFKIMPEGMKMPG